MKDVNVKVTVDSVSAETNVDRLTTDIGKLGIAADGTNDDIKTLDKSLSKSKKSTDGLGTSSSKAKTGLQGMANMVTQVVSSLRSMLLGQNSVSGAITKNSLANSVNAATLVNSTTAKKKDTVAIKSNVEAVHEERNEIQKSNIERLKTNILQKTELLAINLAVDKRTKGLLQK